MFVCNDWRVGKNSNRGTRSWVRNIGIYFRFISTWQMILLGKPRRCICCNVLSWWFSSVSWSTQKLKLAIRLNQAPQFCERFYHGSNCRTSQADMKTGRHSMISSNRWDQTLSKIEKLHYLKVCLRGEALVRNLLSIVKNYQWTWNMLVDHFGNKRVLLRSYFTTFTSLKNEGWVNSWTA